jgi:predicted aldo/keto reductase-like oxidoreductase
MGTKEQLDENVETASRAKVGMLTEQDKATIEQVREVFRSAYKVDCSGCNYCMPCPQGINIPSCFAAYNARYVTGYVSGITLYVTSLVTSQPGKQIGPGSCIECGNCEKLCPQHIAIPQELKTVKKKMEPFFLGAALKIYWLMNGERRRDAEKETQKEN